MTARDLEQRRGATRVADVPAAVLEAIHAGTTQTRNLTEQLAADLRLVAKHAGIDPSHVDPAAGFMARLRGLAAGVGPGWRDCAGHPGDLVREAAALAMGADDRLSPGERLAEVRRFADDPNAGVREIAWMAVRPLVAADVAWAVASLTPWTGEVSPNLRRFTVEVTRPRGVWCKHIETLKADPSPALPLLKPLRADSSRYVQDSVANWLNDAGKTSAAWVREVCGRWSDGDATAATARIVSRGLRTIGR